MKCSTHNCLNKRLMTHQSGVKDIERACPVNMVQNNPVATVLVLLSTVFPRNATFLRLKV
eukprot:6189534-Pleurochrysis_carterae.AAC.1